MNGKPFLRLVAITQIFLLFAVVCLPMLIRSMQQSLGRWVYGLLTAVCIAFALLLRRALADLDM